MSLIPRKYYLDDFFDDFVSSKDGSVMKCDIYEKGGKVHIELDVPGFNKEDVKVDLDDGILTIAASKHEDKEEKEKRKLLSKNRHRQKTIDYIKNKRKSNRN